MSQGGLVNPGDEGWPMQINRLTVGKPCKAHYHTRICEGVISYDEQRILDSYMMLDDQRVDIISSSQFIGIAPGCVHIGQGENRASYMCVLERHDKFADRDMQFDHLPLPQTDGVRHFSYDLSNGPVNASTWPYTVELETLSATEFVAQQFTTHIVLPSQGNVQVEVSGDEHRFGSGWLVALQPGCTYRLKSRLRVYSFRLHDDWRERLAALAFESK